ncbi:MAG: hypothetical protein U0528_19220 [Anaerolineae bacterium]
MIWKRTIATQMADAQLTLVTAAIRVEDAEFQATGNGSISLLPRLRRRLG